MLSGVVGAILGLIGGVAAILALLSKELENKPTIKYVIVAALFGLMLYAMIGSIFAINSSATDTTSSGGGNNGNTNLSATITTQETELANLRATMASGREAASLVTQAPITQIAVTQVSVTQIAVTEVAVTQVAVTQVVQPPVAADATLSPSAAQPSTNIPVGFEKRTSAGDILFGIDNVNILSNGRMRWNIYFFNKTNDRCLLRLFNEKTYLSDNNGKKYEVLASDRDEPVSQSEAGTKQTFWLEFEKPTDTVNSFKVVMGLDPSGAPIGFCAIGLAPFDLPWPPSSQ